MADLKDARLIYLKGFLFLLLGTLAAAVLFVRYADWQTTTLLVLTVWAFCRFYYFAFYVVQHYVDDNFRFSGLIDFTAFLIRGRGATTLGETRAPKNG